MAVGSGWPDGLSGAWWYDALRHELVSTDWAKLPTHSSTDVIFAVTSHVERAMWRYRDVRAFRPVLIDAGHVIETLLSSVTATGWNAAWFPSAGWSGSDLATSDPVIGYVVATQDGDPPAPEQTELGARTSVITGSLRTNPFVSVSPIGDSLVARNHREGLETVVNAEMLAAMAYATPSSRRDRPTSPHEISAETSIDRGDLRELVEKGFLLAEAQGDSMWARGRAWFDHDWFLSLLMHVEEVAATDAATGASWPLLEGLPDALAARRTCRRFTDQALQPSTVERLASAGSARSAATALMTVRRACAGWAEGTYLLRSGSWLPISASVPDEETIRNAAIGQPWAAGFAVLFWLVPAGDHDTRGGWEASLVECGRLGQRLILSVSADPRVGCFQSPALVDDVLVELLGEAASDEGCYMVAFGIAGDEPSKDARFFDPGSMFCTRRTPS